MDRKKTRRRRLRNTGKSVHLPHELIEEILSKLPAKSLLRFKCVSKSWRCLIGSDRFIKTQLEKSIKDPSYAHWRVAFESHFYGLTQCSAGTNNHQRPFDDSTNNHLTTPDCEILGHCNGLLCILKGSRCLFLWNPTTRISVELPELHSYVEKYGFGMDEQTGAYKVFAAFISKHRDDDDGDEDEDEYIGRIYSSETNSWKTVEHGGLDVEDDAGLLVGRKLHWLMVDGEYIESFDLSSEIFEKIELPYQSSTEAYNQQLKVARGTLRVTVTYKSDDDSDKRDDDTWDRVKVTEGGAKEHWVKVKTEIDNEDEGIENIVLGCGKTVYVESLVWPVPLKNH